MHNPCGGTCERVDGTRKARVTKQYIFPFLKREKKEIDAERRKVTTNNLSY
jgi:hypothetical protein